MRVPSEERRFHHTRGESFLADGNLDAGPRRREGRGEGPEPDPLTERRGHRPPPGGGPPRGPQGGRRRAGRRPRPTSAPAPPRGRGTRGPPSRATPNRSP